MEKKADQFERERLLAEENASKPLPSKARKERCIELALGFVSRPYDIYKNGSYALKKLVLRLAFLKPVTFAGDGVYSTPELTLPFRMLGGNLTEKS